MKVIDKHVIMMYPESYNGLLLEDRHFLRLQKWCLSLLFELKSMTFEICMILLVRKRNSRVQIMELVMGFFGELFETGHSL